MSDSEEDVLVDQLAEAIQSGDLQSTQKAVEAGANINYSFLNYKPGIQLTPVAYACVLRKNEIAEYLLSQGADVFLVPSRGRLLIQIAQSVNEDNKMAKFILERMKNLNVPDGSGTTPFTRVVATGNVRACKFLVENMNANVCRKGLKSGDSPLVTATKNDSFYMVKYLLEHRALPCIDSALCCALQNGHIEIAEYFINQGADVSRVYSNGSTPLMISLENAFIEIVDLLLEKKADVNVANSNGVTPIAKSLEMNFQSVTGKLIKAGADVKLNDHNGKTAFMRIIEMGDVVLCKLAVEAGGKIDNSFVWYATPVQLGLHFSTQMRLLSARCRECSLFGMSV